MQTICTSLQTDNHTNTPSLNFFFKPDPLSDAQKHIQRVILQKHCENINKHTVLSVFHKKSFVISGNRNEFPLQVSYKRRYKKKHSSTHTDEEKDEVFTQTTKSVAWELIPFMVFRASEGC